MLQKISDFPLTAYLAVTGFFRGLKRDERGLSGVVVAILLVLVAVLLVLALWKWISPWLDTLWTKIKTNGNNVGEAVTPPA